MPERYDVRAIAEPWVDMSIVAPADSINAITNFCMSLRGIAINQETIDSERILIKYEMPLAEIITDFFDTLKSMT
jgi:GTP-binding protein LepA